MTGFDALFIYLLGVAVLSVSMRMALFDLDDIYRRIVVAVNFWVAVLLMMVGMTFITIHSTVGHL